MYFLNVIKPKGLTSFDVIRYLRKKLGIRQIGHSGTLDPLAYGVMQIGVGSATKLLDYLPSDKEYIADIKFGYETETYDSEADEIFVQTPNFNLSELKKTLGFFIGKTKQVPPKYSAIKSNGLKLCDMARKNADININAFIREIEINSIDILDFNGYDRAKIKVSCKKGTYIRSLVYDLGKKLGCGAYLSDLARIRAGNFLIENANTLNDDIYNRISPLEALDMNKYELSDDEYFKIINGGFIVNSKKLNFDKILLTKNNKLVSVAVLSDNLIKPKKTFKDS